MKIIQDLLQLLCFYYIVYMENNTVVCFCMHEWKRENDIHRDMCESDTSKQLHIDWDTFFGPMGDFF